MWAWNIFYICTYPSIWDEHKHYTTLYIFRTLFFHCIFLSFRKSKFHHFQALLFLFIFDNSWYLHLLWHHQKKSTFFIYWILYITFKFLFLLPSFFLPNKLIEIFHFVITWDSYWKYIYLYIYTLGSTYRYIISILIFLFFPINIFSIYYCFSC